MLLLWPLWWNLATGGVRLNIYKYEVAPAVSSNLYSVTGEWADFDEAWLKERILSHTSRPFHKFRCDLFSWLMLRAVKEHWAKIKEMYHSKEHI